jgi:hypothetical protein
VVLEQHHQCKVSTVATITARHHTQAAVVVVAVRSVSPAVTQGCNLTAVLVFKRLLRALRHIMQAAAALVSVGQSQLQVSAVLAVAVTVQTLAQMVLLAQQTRVVVVAQAQNRHSVTVVLAVVAL